MLEVNKIKIINRILIYLFIIAIIVAIFIATNFERVLLGIDLLVSIVMLLYINQKALTNRSIQIRLICNYIFIVNITVTILFSGIYNSILFPALYIIPFTYAVVNFSLRVRSGIIILILSILWLILFQDPLLGKLTLVIFISVFIVVIHIIADWLVKKKLL
ncbi:MAG: hypothetical protein AB7V16_09065 [Vulcanibacillus sp.]